MSCICHKPDWLLQQFDEWTSRQSQETPACAKHSCQTSFHSEEIWSHNSPRIRYASLASGQISFFIQNIVDHLQRTSGQGTLQHPRNDHLIKKQKILHEIHWCMCPDGSKIQARYFRQACIGMQYVGLWHGIACERKLGYAMKLKHLSESERLIFSLNL